MTIDNFFYKNSKYELLSHDTAEYIVYHNGNKVIKLPIYILEEMKLLNSTYYQENPILAEEINLWLNDKEYEYLELKNFFKKLKIPKTKYDIIDLIDKKEKEWELPAVLQEKIKTNESLMFYIEDIEFNILNKIENLNKIKKKLILEILEEILEWEKKETGIILDLYGQNLFFDNKKATLIDFNIPNIQYMLKDEIKNTRKLNIENIEIYISLLKKML